MEIGATVLFGLGFPEEAYVKLGISHLDCQVGKKIPVERVLSVLGLECAIRAVSVLPCSKGFLKGLACDFAESVLHINPHPFLRYSLDKFRSYLLEASNPSDLRSLGRDRIRELLFTIPDVLYRIAQKETDVLRRDVVYAVKNAGVALDVAGVGNALSLSNETYLTACFAMRAIVSDYELSERYQGVDFGEGGVTKSYVFKYLFRKGLMDYVSNGKKA